MTPSNVLSLSDVLRQALGISEYNRLTDVEGLRAYRTAQRPVPVPEVGPIAKYLGTFSAKHASAAHSHMVADLVALLRGLDDRAAEYERFLQKTEDLCAAATPGARGFASEIVTRVQDLRRRCPAIEVSDLGQLEKTISARPDAANAAAAQRQRLLSAYREFARQLRTEATLKIIKSPEAAEFCERLRALTREVLRNRYYLEGDWLGERPIGALR